MRAPYVLALVCALVALGCDDSRRRYDAGPIAARDAGRDGSSSGSGLRIVELTTSSEALTEGEDVLVQARLEDPDGLDDIVSIFVLDGQTVVSSLGPTPTFGLYEGRVAWSQLHEASPIELVGSSSRALSVRVTDGVGNTDERAFTLRLQCGDGSARHGACDGACVELDRDPDHCGACDNVCAAASNEGGCFEGACYAPSECRPFDGSRTCAAECASQGRTCAEACFTAFESEPHGSLAASLDYCTYTSWWYLAQVGSCDANAGTGYIRCCCSDP